MKEKRSVEINAQEFCALALDAKSQLDALFALSPG
jgi:hypothetical protein